MKRIALAALALALCTSAADAGGRGRVWKGLLLGALIAGVAGPAFAGGYYDGPPRGYYDDGPRYRFEDSPRARYGYPNNNPNAYGYRPAPRPPSVPVEPAFCERHDTIYVPSANKWMCKPVMVPRSRDGY